MTIDSNTCVTTDQIETVHQALMGAWDLAGFAAEKTADPRNRITANK